MVKISRGKAGLTRKGKGTGPAAKAQYGEAPADAAGPQHDYGAVKVVQLDSSDKARLGINYAPFRSEEHV